jgi:pilus assembly protein CpaE
MSIDMTAGPRQSIKILVVPGQDPVGEWMADVVKTEQDMVFLGVVRDISELLETISKTAPDVILLDIGSGILQRTELLAEVAGTSSGAATIVVAMLTEVDMVRQAMLYGAQGFLLKPFSEAELLSSIRQAFSLVVQRRAELSSLVSTPRVEPVQATDLAPVIAVFSPKGGVGCTTVAINLAVALQELTGQTSVLVDADLRFGDVDTALNLSSATSIGTLVSQLDELDPQLLERSLVAHSSGVKVVVAPPHLDVADSIRPEDLKKLLGRLSELPVGHVVVDAWSSLDDCTLAILDTCQQLIIVVTPQVTALRDVHRFLEVLNLLGFDRERTRLVLNHCYHRAELKLSDVERAIGHPIVGEIEYAPSQVTASLNRGTPLVQEYRDGPAAQSLVKLAQHLVDLDPRRRGGETEDGAAKEAKPRRRSLLAGR